MHLRPEDIPSWTVEEIPSVTQKATEIFGGLGGKLLADHYDKLKVMLETYPPNQRYFSHPRMDLGGGHVFWVKSEGGRLIVRAKYFVWAETCVVDKLYTAGDKPQDLEM